MIYTNELHEALNNVSEANDILKLISITAENASNEEWLQLRDAIIVQLQQSAGTRLTKATQIIDKTSMALSALQETKAA